MRYWVSWVQITEDYRPLTFPPNKGILGWWCSGTTSNDEAVLCALVEANTELKAQEAVWKDWPETKNIIWRFFEEVQKDWKPSDRFPISDWSKERIK